MADSTHTLELELRTKDFATEAISRVGDAGKEAGQAVTAAMDAATSSIQRLVNVAQSTKQAMAEGNSMVMAYIEPVGEVGRQAYKTESAIRKIGDAAKEAGSAVDEGLSRPIAKATETSKGFVQQWLRLDKDFARVARVGALTINSVSAAVATANADTKNWGESLLSVGSSVASGFAIGGPLGAAVTGTSAVVGLLANAFQSAGREAEAAAKIASEAWAKSTTAIAAGAMETERTLKTAVDARAARERQIAIDKQVAQGADREAVTLAYDQAEAISQAQKELAAANRSWLDIKQSIRAAGNLSKEAIAAGVDKQQNETLRIAAERVTKAEEALRLAKESVAEAQRQAKWATFAADQEERKKKEKAEALALDKQTAEEDRKRVQASNDRRESLQREATEMIRLSKLSEDERAVDSLRQMSDRLRLGNRKDLADEVDKLVAKQLEELATARELAQVERERRDTLETMNAVARDMGKFWDDIGGNTKTATDNLQKAASVDLAQPIREANAELKKMATVRQPGVPGAMFDENGQFVGLGLAAAREERRTALRTRKRRRAEAGRMGMGIAGSINLRSGRRAGGLGAFSAWQGGGGDMGTGVNEPPPETITSSFLEDPELLRLRKEAAKKKAAAVNVPFSLQGAASDIPRVQMGAQEKPPWPDIVKMLGDQAKSSDEMAKSAVAMSEESKKTAESTTEAKDATSEAADAAKQTAESMRQVGSNLGSVVVALKDLQESADETKRQVERLLEAARLRGGN